MRPPRTYIEQTRIIERNVSDHEEHRRGQARPRAWRIDPEIGRWGSDLERVSAESRRQWQRRGAELAQFREQRALQERQAAGWRPARAGGGTALGREPEPVLAPWRFPRRPSRHRSIIMPRPESRSARGSTRDHGPATDRTRAPDAAWNATRRTTASTTADGPGSASPMIHHRGQVRTPAAGQSLPLERRFPAIPACPPRADLISRANMRWRHGRKLPGCTSHPSTPTASLLPRPGRPGMTHQEGTQKPVKRLDVATTGDGLGRLRSGLDMATGGTSSCRRSSSTTAHSPGAASMSIRPAEPRPPTSVTRARRLRPGPRSRRDVDCLPEVVRRTTEALCAPLEIEDYVVQSMPDASPAKWHLAHTSWFFETFVLAAEQAGLRPVDPQYSFLFNSYYNAVGERIARDRRGLLSRPTVAEVYALPRGDRRQDGSVPRSGRRGRARPGPEHAHPGAAPRAAAPGADPHRPQARPGGQSAAAGLSRAERRAATGDSAGPGPRAGLRFPAASDRSATRAMASPSTTRRRGTRVCRRLRAGGPAW